MKLVTLPKNKDENTMKIPKNSDICPYLEYRTVGIKKKIKKAFGGNVSCSPVCGKLLKKIGQGLIVLEREFYLCPYGATASLQICERNKTVEVVMRKYQVRRENQPVYGLFR